MFLRLNQEEKMNTHESVESMTKEQIAESLEITKRCLVVTGVDEFQALIAGAGFIRGEEVTDCTKDFVLEKLNSMAGELEGLPQWQSRHLVYKKAIRLIQAA